MKSVDVDRLLDAPGDRVSFQTEWTAHGQHGARSLSLEIALFAGNVGPGLYMVSCLDGYRPGLLIGFLTVLIGYGLPHLIFLGRMARFWRAAMRPGHSWISRGFVFANFFLLFAFLSVAHELPWVGNLPLLANAAASGFILAAGFVCALLLVLYPGFLFSSVRAIPFWNSVMLGPLFLVQALGGGVALTIILARDGTGGLERLLAVDCGLLIATALIEIIYLRGRYKCGGAAKASVERLIRGKYRRLFLMGAMGGGLILPLLLFVLALLGYGSVPCATAGAALQLYGILAFKYYLLNAGAYNAVYDDRLRQVSVKPG